MQTEKIPMCAAAMGCLCAGHARGNDPDLPCDTCESQKIRIVCAACGSHDVRRDAFAAWNVQRQEWELSAVMDQGYCEDCEGEADLKEAPI